MNHKQKILTPEVRGIGSLLLEMLICRELRPSPFSEAENGEGMPSKELVGTAACSASSVSGFALFAKLEKGQGDEDFQPS